MLVRLAKCVRRDLEILLEYIYQTEVSFIYASSQLALSAIIHAGKSHHAWYGDTLRVDLPDRAPLVYASSQLALSAIIHAGKASHVCQAEYGGTLGVDLPDRGATGLRTLTACSLSHHTCW